jgi:translation elongation factor EF-Tu-like GTPase
VPEGAFVMPVEDVFSITGRGTVATGRITAGTIKVGDQVMITRAGQQLLISRVTGVEAFRKRLTEASAGDNVGLLLEGVDKGQLLRGDLISR